MRVEREQIDGWLERISAAGELDAYTAPKLRESVTAALDEGIAWIMIDLTEATYIDSVALGILIGAAKRAGERNGDIAVVCGPPHIRRVFEVSGTAEMLNVVESVEEAAQVLASERKARGGHGAEDEGSDAR